MSSYRVQVNDAFKQALTGETVAGDRVFTKLDRPLDPRKDFPAIVIYTMESRRGPREMGGSLIQRMVTVAIEAAVTSTPESAQEDAESIADAIEAIIEADPSLGNVVHEAQWQQTVTAVSSTSNVTVGVCLLEYTVEIFTEPVRAGIPGPDKTPTLVFSHPVWPEPEPADVCEGGVCDTPAWGGIIENTPEEP